MRGAIVMAVALAAFVLLENAVFNTGWYARRVLDPDSSAGFLELRLWNEEKRPRSEKPQVLMIGDSRMGFFPKYVDRMTPGLRDQFATISTPGTTPRDWYYMLRGVDPRAGRYAAVVIPVYDYDDAEVWEHLADREQDMHYLVARLGWGDVFEFAGSYDDPELKFRAALGILLKGTIYKPDFQDFLLHRKARLKYAAMARRESSGWYYDYAGVPQSVAGVKIDWARKTVEVPAELAAEHDEFRDWLFSPRPPFSGRQSAYLKKWFGKIYEHYRGSRTKLIFFRLPRGPFLRPDAPPFDAQSSVRELARRPGVILDDEHDFDFLEKPELFQDHQHLNGAGQAEFSRVLAVRVQELLDRHAL